MATTWLAGQLSQLGIDTMEADNGFTHIADWSQTHPRTIERAGAPVLPDLPGLASRYRIEGRRIKHMMKRLFEFKLYDKFGLTLRIETTVNDLTVFKH